MGEERNNITTQNIPTPNPPKTPELVMLNENFSLNDEKRLKEESEK